MGNKKEKREILDDTLREDMGRKGRAETDGDIKHCYGSSHQSEWYQIIKTPFFSNPRTDIIIIPHGPSDGNTWEGRRETVEIHCFFPVFFVMVVSSLSW